MFFVFFFFKQKTAYDMRISDWSSDVCSSDLELHAAFAGVGVHRLALAVADHRRQRRLIVAKLVDRGQIAREDRPDQSDTKQTGEREIAEPAEPAPRPQDRKSTRLNSSH